jgi:hypothetical protein
LGHLGPDRWQEADDQQDPLPAGRKHLPSAARNATRSECGNRVHTNDDALRKDEEKIQRIGQALRRDDKR